jgi:hypothetical protein
MPEHHKLGTLCIGDLIEGGIASSAGCGLWPTFGTYLDVRNLHRVEAETDQNFGGVGSNLPSDSLDAVLNDDRPRTNAGPRSLEGNGRGERQTIRAARTSNQHQVTGNHAGGIPAFTHGTANIGNGRRQAWTVSQGGLFSVILFLAMRDFLSPQAYLGEPWVTKQ